MLLMGATVTGTDCRSHVSNDPGTNWLSDEKNFVKGALTSADPVFSGLPSTDQSTVSR